MVEKKEVNESSIAFICSQDLEILFTKAFCPLFENFCNRLGEKKTSLSARSIQGISNLQQIAIIFPKTALIVEKLISCYDQQLKKLSEENPEEKK